MNMQTGAGAPLERYVELMGDLTPERLAEIAGLVSDNVLFRDPFNEVRGRDRFVAVFQHMFAILKELKFTFEDRASAGRVHFFTWQFSARHAQLGPFTIGGVSRIETDETGLVVSHIDYWDSDSAFMARIPVLGKPIGWLRKFMELRLS